MQHFEIERRYFEIQGWDWGIVTEKTINRIKADNISQCRKYFFLERYEPFSNMDNEQIDEYKEALFRVLFNTEKPLYNIAEEFDEMFQLPSGSGISIFEHLIIRKKITVDLNVPLNYNYPIIVKSPGELFEDEND